MPHRNAPLTETGRLRLARCVVEDSWPLRRAAERFQVSPTTAQRWADRYRAFGEAGMSDRSSRPRTSPRRTPTRRPRAEVGKPGSELQCEAAADVYPGELLSQQRLVPQVGVQEGHHRP